MGTWAAWENRLDHGHTGLETLYLPTQQKAALDKDGQGLASEYLGIWCLDKSAALLCTDPQEKGLVGALPLGFLSNQLRAFCKSWGPIGCF